MPIRDSFTDANGTFLEDHIPDVGGSWSAFYPQAGKISNGTLIGNGSVPGYPLYYNPTQTGRNVSMAVEIHSLTANSVGAFFRVPDTSTFDTFYFAGINTSGFTFLGNQGGVNFLADTTRFTFQPGLYRFSIMGNLMRGYWEGNLVASLRDNTLINPGYFGFRSGTGIVIDNLNVDGKPDWTPQLAEADGMGIGIGNRSGRKFMVNPYTRGILFQKKGKWFEYRLEEV